VFGDDAVYDGEADVDAGGDGPQALLFGTAGDDRAAFVVVDDGGAAADAAAPSGDVEAVDRRNDRTLAAGRRGD
jgi:hypothetical protein